MQWTADWEHEPQDVIQQHFFTNLNDDLLIIIYFNLIAQEAKIFETQYKMVIIIPSHQDTSSV
jgi:hypothetical protein